MRNIVPILLDQKVTIKDKIRYVPNGLLIEYFFLLLFCNLVVSMFPLPEKDEENAALLILIWSDPDFLRWSGPCQNNQSS
jgi:hypothetical protein